jgi:hypothetical protein
VEDDMSDRGIGDVRDVIPAGGPPSSTGGGGASEPGGAREQAAQAAGQAREVAATASEQGREVAGTAAEGARRVASTTGEQVGNVAREASTQARAVMSEATGQLKEQASAQTGRAASGLRNAASQLEALADGRPEEAGPVADYARQATERLGALASRLEGGGVDGIVEDLQGFARRRPGLFLLGAAAAGFAAGRLVRGAQASQQGDEDRAPSAAPVVADLGTTSVTPVEAPIADVPAPTVGTAERPRVL